MPDQTIRQALEVQERHLDWYCPKDMAYSDDVRNAIIKATNIAGLVLDNPMPVYLMKGIVPTSHEIKHEIFKWKCNKLTHEVLHEDYTSAYGEALLRNHYPTFLCDEELIADTSGRNYYACYYIENVGNKTTLFTKPMRLEQYDRQKAKE